MELEKFSDNGGRAFVVGLHFCWPPRYVASDAWNTSGWVWTGELAHAEAFRTKEEAEDRMRRDMAELINGDKDVKVLKVELKVGPA